MKHTKQLFFILSLVSLGFLVSCSGGSEEPEAQVQQEQETPEVSENNDGISVNAEESSLAWYATKVTGSHDGTVGIKEGTLFVEDGQLTAGTVIIDMTSIIVLDIEDPEYNAKLTNHLKDTDFFSVEDHPTAKIEITSVEPIADAVEGGDTHNVSANLDIKGINNNITFPARIEVEEGSVTADAKFTIDRTAYDIKYGSGKFFPEIGDKMIHDEVEFQVHIIAQ